MTQGTHNTERHATKQEISQRNITNHQSERKWLNVLLMMFLLAWAQWVNVRSKLIAWLSQMNQQEMRYSTISSDRLQRSEKQKFYMQSSIHSVKLMFSDTTKRFKPKYTKAFKFLTCVYHVLYMYFKKN